MAEGERDNSSGPNAHARASYDMIYIISAVIIFAHRVNWLIENASGFSAGSCALTLMADGANVYISASLN
jgi:hypothetical protein